jgi:hypothetical protein
VFWALKISTILYYSHRVEFKAKSKNKLSGTQFLCSEFYEFQRVLIIDSGSEVVREMPASISSLAALVAGRGHLAFQPEL